MQHEQPGEGTIETGGITPEMWGSGPLTAMDDASRGAWFSEAKYAMFIHWGLYSALAGCWQGKPVYGIGEWIQFLAPIPAAEYAATAATFNPVDFDARAIVRLAQEAGMRYIVITAKHHDGFAMFRSAASPYNIVDATPFQRDPIAELAEACREAGMRLGFYYSQTQDWHEPDAPTNNHEAAPDADFRRYLRTKAIPQIEELLSQYGDIALIWFDTPGPITREESQALLERIRELQPGCLINSRIGNGLGDYETLGDQEIPRQAHGGRWETIDTHNDTWGYVQIDQNWKSARELIERLVRVTSRGGNYMLNIGPDGRGKVPELSARILREVGRWLAQHGEAIYGTTPAPLGTLPWGECTQRGQTLYLHVFQWPADGRLRLPGVQTPVMRATLLGEDAQLTVTQQADGLLIEVPVPPASLLPVIAVELGGALPTTSEQYVLHNCVNILDAAAAQCAGCHQDKISWMEKFGDWKHAEHVGEWQTESAASWSFTALEPGLYYIDVEFACPSAADGSEWALTLGEYEVTFPLLATGHLPERGENMADWPLARFRTYRVGLCDIPAAGRYQLTLRPLTENGNSVLVSTITLLPTAG